MTKEVTDNKGVIKNSEVTSAKQKC